MTWYLINYKWNYVICDTYYKKSIIMYKYINSYTFINYKIEFFIILLIDIFITYITLIVNNKSYILKLFYNIKILSQEYWEIFFSHGKVIF